MMKLINLIVIGSLSLLFSCVQNDGVAPTTSATGGTTAAAKVTLSSWARANGAWAVRLDVNGANLNGTTFTMVVKCSDNSEVWCTNSYLSGSADSGAWSTDVCSGHGGMSDAIATSFQTGGVGSYSKSGSVLTLCKFNNVCFDYY